MTLGKKIMWSSLGTLMLATIFTMPSGPNALGQALLAAFGLGPIGAMLLIFPWVDEPRGCHGPIE